MDLDAEDTMHFMLAGYLSCCCSQCWNNLMHVAKIWLAWKNKVPPGRAGKRSVVVTVEKESEKRVQFPTLVEKEGTATTTTTLLSWNRWRRGSRWKFVQRCLQAMQRIYFSARESPLLSGVSLRGSCAVKFAHVCVLKLKTLSLAPIPTQLNVDHQHCRTCKETSEYFEKKICSLVPSISA